MLAMERMQYILDVLKNNKIVQVSDLSKEINVTEETIRRDLEKLEKQELIFRVHGGAYLREGYGNETTVAVREKIFKTEKSRLAAQCMKFVHEQDSIMLDCSTTAIYIARELGLLKKKLTVITNSLSVAKELEKQEQIRMIMIGGERKSRTNSFYGTVAEHALNYYFADKVFISSAGISLEAGMTDYTEDEASVRRKMIERAKECFYVADITKIGRIAVNTIGGIEQMTHLISDQLFDRKEPKLLEELEKRRIGITICEKEKHER